MKMFMLPSFYVIEPTNRCNLKCSICPNSIGYPLKRGYMEWDLFVKIINQIKNVAQIIQLYWMGEPLLHTRLIDMIKYIKKNTCAKVIISTNGNLLNKKIANLLIDSGIDKIIISCDAAESQEVYSQIDLDQVDFVKQKHWHYTTAGYIRSCKKDGFILLHRFLKNANKKIEVLNRKLEYLDAQIFSLE